VVWNEVLEIIEVRPDDRLKITCFDEDLIMDSHVGQQTYRVSDLAEQRRWFPLQYKGKKSAEILLDSEYVLEEPGQPESTMSPDMLRVPQKGGASGKAKDQEDTWRDLKGNGV
jgi:hypothetical protein